ncbi:hypothetical protein EZV73_00850 [Acidaminobacter sp. JC074]|uniref:hypothetical protein n=1 Tax=Acidaminobacter sp. JC074 TaxID=2530199 RepID=UPI001F0DC983|nr:hypothetical protein [Acidaminobacter sp. JC074]MCH4886089.1 hypothetical protein [Acidaminobacter sp. JC074]
MNSDLYKELTSNMKHSASRFIDSKSLQNMMSQHDIEYLGSLLEEAGLYYDMGMKTKGDAIWCEITDMIEASKHETRCF